MMLLRKYLTLGVVPLMPRVITALVALLLAFTSHAGTERDYTVPPFSPAPVGYSWKAGADYCDFDNRERWRTAFEGFLFMSVCRIFSEGRPLIINEEPVCTSSANAPIIDGVQVKDSCVFRGIDGPGSFTVGVGLVADAPAKCEDGCPKEGDPINPLTGNNWQREVDLASRGPMSLGWVRSYNSYVADRPENFSVMGSRWRHGYDRVLRLTEAPTINLRLAHVYLADERVSQFHYDGTGWVSEINLEDRLMEVLNAEDEVVGWRFLNGRTRLTDVFDLDGRLVAIEGYGWTKTLTYDQGRLVGVSDAEGRQLNLTYNGDGRISQVSDQAGFAVSYVYGAFGNLMSANYVDGGSREYLYEDVRHRSALTSLRDETDTLIANWSFDTPGRAVGVMRAGGVDHFSFSYLATHQAEVTDPLGLVRRYTHSAILGVSVPTAIDEFCADCGTRARLMAYDAHRNLISSTDFNGNRTCSVYDPSRKLEVIRLQGLPPGSSCPGDLGSYVPTPGSTEVIHRRIWHPTLREPVELQVIDDDNEVVSLQRWVYNASGQTTASCEYDLPSANAGYECGSSSDPPADVRQTTMVYCEAADVGAPNCPRAGLRLSTDGPRTDVADLTTYSYYEADAENCAGDPLACTYRAGDLHSVSNALGHTVEMLRYDGAGRVLSQRDANGVITDMEYNLRGWMLRRIVRGADDASEADDQITRIDYFPHGLVERVTQPDGAFTAYTYDDAQRLIAVSDGLENRIDYTLDAAGNRTAEATRDPQGALARQLNRVYDQLGRLQTQLRADGSTPWMEFEYDAHGNTDASIDALDRVNDQIHDPLHRLIRSIANVNGSGSERAETEFGYDGLDRLTHVVDPNDLVTAYDYNALGDLEALSSPDTGTTIYAYDEAGNRNSQADARGVTVGYAYDALNRLTAITPPTSELAVGFSYDTAPVECPVDEQFAIGRLSEMTDESGHTRYCYDRFGNLARKLQAVGEVVLITLMDYDSANRLASISYPSGASVRYSRDVQGRITGVYLRAQPGDDEVALVGGVGYLPFGPVSQITYGNGRVLDRQYSQDYEIDRVDDASLGGWGVDFGLDALGNITSLDENTGSGSVLRLVDYDQLNRLAALRDGASELEGYAYDATGNRVQKRVGMASQAYGYPNDSHRLIDIAGISRSYDDVGNTIAIGVSSPAQLGWDYNDLNRMCRFEIGAQSQVTYHYNGRGERVHKLSTDPQRTRLFLYAESGQLLGEYAADGTAIQETVWLDDLPIASLGGEIYPLVLGDEIFGSGFEDFTPPPTEPAKHYYVQPDHLGTPRTLIDPERDVVVWRWNLTGSAFGEHAPEEDPDGDGQGYLFGLRYPGQYFDAESGLHYNYFRDYEPGTGRYIESDPIGLFGGINTYAYAASQPLLLIDPTGESYAAAVGGWIAADGAVPEPSDAAWPKWAGYALAFGGALALDYCLDRSDEDACEKEWREARERCRQLIYEQMQQAAGRRKKRKVTGVTGGYTDVEQCARGLVSERCGGNRVSY